MTEGCAESDTGFKHRNLHIPCFPHPSDDQPDRKQSTHDKALRDNGKLCYFLAL